MECLVHSKAVPLRAPELSPDPGPRTLLTLLASISVHPILYATYLCATYTSALLRLFPLPGRSIVWSLNLSIDLKRPSLK